MKNALDVALMAMGGAFVPGQVRPGNLATTCPTRLAKHKNHDDPDCRGRSICSARQVDPVDGRRSHPFQGLPAFCRLTAIPNRPPTPISRSKSGCQSPAGMANSAAKATVDLPEKSTIALSVSRSPRDTRRLPQTPAMRPYGGDATWALGHPEKIIDFAYRAIHEMTRLSAKPP